MQPILERAGALYVPLYVPPGVPPAVVREVYYSGFDPAGNFSLATAGWGWHSEGLQEGKLTFRLSGQKLRGSFALIRIRGFKGKASWLLIKQHDAYA